jgi:hypothetical protein
MKIRKFILPMIFLLTSCNKQIYDFNYNFTKIHLKSLNKCLEIKSWNDYEGDMIQVTLKDEANTVMVISDTEATLIKGTCPYCNK